MKINTYILNFVNYKCWFTHILQVYSGLKVWYMYVQMCTHDQLIFIYQPVKFSPKWNLTYMRTDNNEFTVLDQNPKAPKIDRFVVW